MSEIELSIHPLPSPICIATRRAFGVISLQSKHIVLIHYLSTKTAFLHSKSVIDDATDFATAFSDLNHLLHSIMSHEPSAKRQRVDSVGTHARIVPEFNLGRIEELSTKIAALPPSSIQAIAKAVVLKEPSGYLATLVDQKHLQLKEQERARAAQGISFSKYIDQANYVLNEKYARLSETKQYDALGDAQSAVEGMLIAIVKRTKDFSAYATKKSAVETMRSIFEILLESESLIAHEVRQDCADWDRKFLQVMGRFTEEELERLITEDEGAWLEQFRKLVEIARNYDLLDRLQESLDDLEAYQAGTGEDEDEDEDEDASEAAADELFVSVNTQPTSRAS